MLVIIIVKTKTKITISEYKEKFVTYKTAHNK